MKDHYRPPKPDHDEGWWRPVGPTVVPKAPALWGYMQQQQAGQKADKPAFEARKLIGASPYANLDTLLRNAVMANPLTVAVFEADIGGGFFERYFVVRTEGGRKAEIDLSAILEAGELPGILRRWVFIHGLDKWEERVIGNALR